MSLTHNKQTILPFEAGKQYDGAEVLAYLASQSSQPKKGKRAPSAYNVFMADATQRERLKTENPEMTPKEMMGALAKLWKTLSVEEKAAYKPAASPSAPVAASKKRAPSAYNCFIASKSEREALKAAQPELTPKEMMSALAKKWKTLTAEEKAAYQPERPTSPVSPPKKKRAPSAYNRFIADKDRREALKRANPDVSPREIMSLMAADWKTLSEEDKAAYQ